MQQPHVLRFVSKPSISLSSHPVFFLGLLFCWATSLHAQSTVILPPDSMEIGRQYTAWFLEEQVDSLWAHTADSFKERFQQETFVNQVRSFSQRAGEQTEVVSERYVRRNGMPQFWHTARYSSFPEPLVIRWVILPEGTIGGIGINPESQNPSTDS